MGQKGLDMRVPVLVTGLIVLLWLAAGSAAGSSVAPEPPAVSDARATGPEVVRAGETTTHTMYLPWIAKRYPMEDGPFGVQVYGVDLDWVYRMTAMGMRWVRLPLYWRTIEPQNTTPQYYTWQPGFEQQLAGFSASGVQVILTLDSNPSWAATYLNGPIDRVGIGELTQFVQAAVWRYSQPPYNVKHWEFYNEPDNGNVLFAEQGAGYFGHTPGAYVDVLEAVYQPIKSVDPEAQVLLGGLAYDAWPDPFVEDFLDQVLINGGAAYFDVMNFHYYPAFRANWEPYGHDILGKLTYLRNKLAAYGVQKPFACTETGWFTNPDAGGSDEVQSRFVAQVFVRGASAELYPVIWFMLHDSPWDPRSWGLVDLELNPKPSYYAFQTLTTQLFRADYARTLGPEETGSEQVEAYEFTTPGHTIVVAWTNDDGTHELALEAVQVKVVDKFGNGTIVYDGDDGLIDGRVHVWTGPSPVYLRLGEAQ